METSNYTRKNFPLIGMIIFACLTICIVSIQLFLNNCLWWECAPTRKFNVLDLSIPSALFPDNSTYDSIHEDSDDDPITIETGSQTVYWDGGNGLASYIVERYATTKTAIKRYSLELRLFSNWDTHIPWKNVSNEIYISPYADEHFIGCGSFGANNDYRCGFEARYQEFLFSFNATMDNKMQVENFKKIVIWVDQQMKKFLDSE